MNRITRLAKLLLTRQAIVKRTIQPVDQPDPNTFERLPLPPGHLPWDNTPHLPEDGPQLYPDPSAPN
jgi:hypothetical protein